MSSNPSKGFKAYLELVGDLDYKNLTVVQRFISPYAKILPRRKNGLNAAEQRKIATAIKRARLMALIPITKK